MSQVELLSLNGRTGSGSQQWVANRCAMARPWGTQREDHAHLVLPEGKGAHWSRGAVSAAGFEPWQKPLAKASISHVGASKTQFQSFQWSTSLKPDWCLNAGSTSIYYIIRVLFWGGISCNTRIIWIHLIKSRAPFSLKWEIAPKVGNPQLFLYSQWAVVPRWWLAPSSSP